MSVKKSAKVENMAPLAAHRHTCKEPIWNDWTCRTRGHCLCECGAKLTVSKSGVPIDSKWKTDK